MSIKKVLIFCAGALLLTVIFDLVFVYHKAYYWWHEFIGFDIVFGFLGCVAIIVFSKFLGRAFIQKRESYYDKDGDNGGADD